MPRLDRLGIGAPAVKELDRLMRVDLHDRAVAEGAGAQGRWDGGEHGIGHDVASDQLRWLDVVLDACRRTGSLGSHPSCRRITGNDTPSGSDVCSTRLMKRLVSG